MKLHSVLFGLGALVALSTSALAYNGSLSPSDNACLFPSHADQGSGLTCPTGTDETDRMPMMMKHWHRTTHHHGTVAESTMKY